MALVLTGPPTLEPISLAEAKAHLRVDNDDEDALITRLISTARDHLEKILSTAMVTQTWTLWLDGWPHSGIVGFGIAPVNSIESIRVHDYDGMTMTVPPEAYWLDAVAVPARLIARGGLVWPTPGRPLNGIEIVFTAGFGAAAEDIPASLRQSILLLVAHWFERREPVEVGVSGTPVPGMIPQLIAPYRMQRL